MNHLHARVLVFCVIVSIACAARVSAQEEELPLCGIVTPEEIVVMKEGMKLHDAGDYDGALKKYAGILQYKADCANALYESAHSCEAKGDYAAGLEFARRGLAYKSPFRANLYEKLAACYAGLEQYDSAVVAIDKGLMVDSTLPTLYCLLGQIGIDTQRPTPAASALQKAVELDPDVERYHALLGVAYGNSGRRLPAIMAMSVALATNPGSPRAADMNRMIDGLWIAGLERNAEGKVSLNPNAFDGIRKTTTRDGNFMIAELTICSMATEDLKDSATVNSMEKFIKRFEIIADLVGPMAPRDTSDKGFARQYYPGFFVELKERKMLEPFCYYIRQAAGDPSVRTWVQKHEEEMSKFLVWWREYTWPKVTWKI